jgi:Rrf2 family protein
MKVSTRVEYGVMALLEIAKHTEKGESVSATEIAEKQKISQKYLEQILPQLRQAGLIKAQKGLRGGYRISRAADSIHLAEVINALDDSILADMDTGGEPEIGLRNSVNACLWEKINAQLKTFAEKKTLSELLAECSEHQAESWDLYII